MKTLNMTRTYGRKSSSILLLLPMLTIYFSSCSDGAPNRFVGHTYKIVPVNSVFKMKLGMSMATIEHEYTSNHEVLVTTYIGKKATKKESMAYSLDDSIYKLDNERYDVSFAGDTAVFAVNGDVLFGMVRVK